MLLVQGDMDMTTIDFSPLFRNTVGFDRLMSVADAALRQADAGSTYPPYNIERLGENDYRITMAVAGFGEDDLTITVEDNRLVVSGKIGASEEKVTYLHRGIAGRAFERRFELAEFIKVAGAELKNGLLHVSLVREIPEERKPRTISINGVSGTKTLEGTVSQAA